MNLGTHFINSLASVGNSSRNVLLSVMKGQKAAHSCCWRHLLEMIYTTLYNTWSHTIYAYIYAIYATPYIYISINIQHHIVLVVTAYDLCEGVLCTSCATSSSVDI